MRSTRSVVTFAFAVILAGCGSTPPPLSAEPGGVWQRRVEAAPAAGSEFERMQRDRALTFVRQKRWSDASLSWEVLTVLRPDVPEYAARLAESRRAIDSAVADRMNAAQQASRRGEIDAASKQYLAVLALQPDNAVASEALRGLERERNKRTVLGKYSRLTITRRVADDAEASPGGGRAGGRNDVEDAALLAGDGEFDEAIGILERRLAADRRDDQSRRLLASVYYRKAESLLPRDPAAATQALQKSVRLDPDEPHAAARLKQLKGTAMKPGASASSVAAASSPAR